MILTASEVPAQQSTDTTLHHDLINCPNIGLIIGADDVTLDLNYHTIDGATNSSTVRLEGHAAFGTERTSAAARIMP